MRSRHPRRFAGVRPHGADGRYAFGHVSGGHFNPAVLGSRATAGSPGGTPWYTGAQLVGGRWPPPCSGASPSGFGAAASGFASNGYAERSPGGYSLLAVLITEIVLTAFFLFVILGGHGARPGRILPLAIGLRADPHPPRLIPVSNTSVNPARSLGVAWFEGGDARAGVAFIVAPVIGAVIAGWAPGAPA